MSAFMSMLTDVLIAAGITIAKAIGGRLAGLLLAAFIFVPWWAGVLWFCSLFVF